jgi:hypothetical protein
MDPKQLAKKIGRLSSRRQQEAEQFVDQLLAQEEKQNADPGPFSFEWAGALAHLRDKYTSVELQKKASEWRLDS